MRLALPPRARAAFVALLVVPALVLSGCGADNEKKPSAEPSVDLPTGNVDVPEGVTLTKAGTELAFGEAATVAYQPNTQRSSVLEITVASVQTGAIADLAAYQLGTEYKRSTPYYARVQVKNVGSGDLSRAALLVYAVDSTNSLVQPVSFNNVFKPCPYTRLPAGFTAGKVASVCLTYLIPKDRKLVKMSYRPLQEFAPITWTGTVKPAPVKKTKKPAKKKKAQN